MNEQTHGALKSSQTQPLLSSQRQRQRDAVQQIADGPAWTESMADADVLYQPTQDGAPSRVRIWDKVDGTWTRPLDESHVFKYYLKKAVSKCSACSFADLRLGSVESHLERVEEQLLIHREATIENRTVEDGKVVLACTGCAQTFSARPGDAYSHILAVEEAAQVHQGATSQVIRRFSLEPVELPSPTITKNINGQGSPQGTRVGEELRVRSVHKRKRGKRGGRKHG